MSRFSFPSSGPAGRDDAWFRVGTVDVTTTLAIIGMAVASMLVWAVTPDALDSLVLSPSAVRGGEVWRIVTWPLYNEPNLWSVLSLAFFYFFGRELERAMGRNRFGWFCLLLTVVPGVVAVGLQLSVAGMDYVQLACFFGYVVLHPYARTFFNLPLWVLGAVFLGIQVLSLLGVRDFSRIVFLFVIFATALGALSTFGLTRNIPWLPNLERSPKRAAKPKRTRNRKLKAVPNPPAPVRRPTPPRPADGARQAEIDILLDKIAAEGIDSLTADERRRLDEASKRLRDDKR